MARSALISSSLAIRIVVVDIVCDLPSSVQVPIDLTLLFYHRFIGIKRNRLNKVEVFSVYFGTQSAVL